MVIIMNFIFGLWIGSIVTIIIMALLETRSDVVNNKPKVNPKLRADLLKRLYEAKCKEVEKLKADRRVNNMEKKN